MVAADHLRSGDHSFIVGARQLRKALARGSVGRVFLARDADPTITAPLEELSHQHGVECLWVDKMSDLGRACGIEVEARDADPTITAPLEELSHQHGVECLWVDKMSDLGRACGIEVDAAAAATVAN